MQLSHFINMLIRIRRLHPGVDPLILINGKEDFEFIEVTNIKKSASNTVINKNTIREIRINNYE